MWSVFFVFLSYLDRDLVRGDLLQSLRVDAEKQSKALFSIINGTLCAKMSTAHGDKLLDYQVSDGAEVVRSVVSSTGGRLVDCSVTADSAEVERFVYECRLGAKRQASWGKRLDAPFTHMDEAKTTCARFQERSKRRSGSVGEDGRSPPEVLRRSKRGFTYPGTLWCGAGNMADHYEQLGEYEETDSCCRTHDHCPHVIHALSSKYGYTNFKWHSICHCDCDEALKDCLRQVNDTSSRVVGQAFFNVIGAPCFELAYEEQCAERHWYGLCKRYEKLPIAVVKEAVPYDYGGVAVIDVLTRSPPLRKDSGNQESATRSTKVVAGDFVKVLATISTSQSATAGKQSEERKEKKKESAKKKKKGKGRKGKQKVPLSNSIKGEDPVDVQRLAEVPNQPSNEVMKDQPMMETTTVQLRPAEEKSPPSVKSRPSRKGRRKEKLPQPSSGATYVTAITKPKQSPPVCRHKVKRTRPHERGDIKCHQSSSTSHPQILVPLMSTTPALDPTRRLDVPTVCVPKRQPSRGRGRRNKRMKTPSHLLRNASEKVLNPTTMTGNGESAPEGEAGPTRWSPTSTTKPRRNAASAAVHHGLPPMTSTPTPAAVRTSSMRAPTSSTHHISPMQRSIQRAGEQFAWKRRRKAALTARPRPDTPGHHQ
uniref:mediator of DNA damage checkpoint protein 1 n=1 Tax=Doryrhamphus excisus TaxID=161450 RepID=UPI0025AEAAE2|nr:mediator of DNA damage checkpoint protein 1 [Doryrhamphus excisus]